MHKPSDSYKREPQQDYAGHWIKYNDTSYTAAIYFSAFLWNFLTLGVGVNYPALKFCETTFCINAPRTSVASGTNGALL